ncbi:MAG: ABC transporter permease [Candidatus Krumholzibacteriia bacterium]
MPRYILQRLLHAALLVVGLLTVVFFLVHLMPGDPVGLIDEQHLGAGGRDLVRERLGLDRPLLEQYGHWLAGALRGDFGVSLRQQRPVVGIIAEALPNTLLLTLSAFLLELSIGVGIGVTVARHPGRLRSRSLATGGLVLYSLPSFWLGLVAIMVFARDLGWLPAGGMHAPDAAWLPFGARGLDLLRHLLLPMLVLGLGNVAVSARFTRSSLGRILADDWVLAARARGVPEGRLVWRHALRVASLPVITWVGFSLPRLVGGAVAVEEVFAWPGLGRVAVQALLARDYPVIVAVTAVVAVVVALGGLLADLLARWADPRLRLDGDRPEVR